MIRATTRKGTPVWVSTIKDVEPNKGGLYCEIYLNMYGDRFDDFCIHEGDCDLNNDRDVIKHVREYVSTINEY